MFKKTKGAGLILIIVFIVFGVALWKLGVLDKVFSYIKYLVNYFKEEIPFRLT